jgi:hypothetical protein
VLVVLIILLKTVLRELRAKSKEAIFPFTTRKKWPLCPQQHPGAVG